MAVFRAAEMLTQELAVEIQVLNRLRIPREMPSSRSCAAEARSPKNEGTERPPAAHNPSAVRGSTETPRPRREV